MVRNESNPKFLATLFAVVYLFVALFSQNFHDHGSGLASDEFNSSKSDQSFKRSTDLAHYADCLSCHLLHEGKHFQSGDFHFTALSAVKFQSEFSTPNATFLLNVPLSIKVRGPPALFI